MLEVGFTATRLREDLNTVNEAESSGFSSRALWIKGYRRYRRPHILAHAGPLLHKVLPKLSAA